MGSSHLLEAEKILSNKIKRLKNLIKETQESEIQNFERNVKESKLAIENERNNKKKYLKRIKSIIFSSVGFVISLCVLGFGVKTGLLILSILGSLLIGASCFTIGYNKPTSFVKYKESKKRLMLLEAFSKYQNYTKSRKLEAMEKSLIQKEAEHKKLIQKIHSMINKNKSQEKTVIEITEEINLEK